MNPVDGQFAAIIASVSSSRRECVDPDADQRVFESRLHAHDQRLPGVQLRRIAVRDFLLRPAQSMDHQGASLGPLRRQASCPRGLPPRLRPDQAAETRRAQAPEDLHEQQHRPVLAPGEGPAPDLVAPGRNARTAPRRAGDSEPSHTRRARYRPDRGARVRDASCGFR